IVAAVEQVARESGLSMAQVAIQWAARQPALGAVILGSRNLAQFEDNLAALDHPLPDDAMQALDACSTLRSTRPSTAAYRKRRPGPSRGGFPPAPAARRRWRGVR